MRRRAPNPRAAWVLGALILGLGVTAAFESHAQPYARFAVPDSALAAALRGGSATYERTWNALLVSEIRASLVRADSSARLATLASRVARAEPGALGSHIAPDAWRLRTAWRVAELRTRVSAAVAESLGVAAQGTGEWARADSLFRRSLAHYRAIAERRREAWVLGSLEVVATRAGDLARADSLCRLALVARRAIGDPVMVGNSLYDLGNIAQASGRFAEALDWHRAAALQRETTGETAKRGTALRGMAVAWGSLGQRDSALALYPQALELTVAGGDSARTLEVLEPYARLLAEAGRLDEAQALQRRSLTLAEQRQDVASEARILGAWAYTLRQAGDFTGSIRALERAAALERQLDDPARLARMLVDLGNAWYRVHDAASARPPLERAVELADSLGDVALSSQALNNLALVAVLDGDPRGGERLARRALAQALSTGDSSLVHDAATTHGIAASSQDHLDEARTAFTLALNAGSGMAPEFRAYDRLNLGHVASRQARVDDAEVEFQLAVALADSAQAPDPLWLGWLGLGAVAEQRGDVAAALAWDRRAASMIDTLRARQGDEGAAVQLFGRRLFAYEALIHLLSRLDEHYPDSAYAAEAFTWSERAKARAFLEQVAGGGADGVRVQPLTVAQAQSQVPNGSALLAYSVGDSSSSVWVITRSRWRHVMLPARRALEARVEILRRALADPTAADAPVARGAARALYEQLVAPVAADLAHARTIIVAPDDVLSLVPFEALLARDVPASGAIPKGSWLVERWEVSYTPSATALAAIRTGSPGRGIVALGDPDFGLAQRGREAARAGAAPPAHAPDGSLARLPNTAAEIVAISALARGRAVHVLSGARATRDSLLALPELRKALLLHLATHGIASTSDPSRSGLWLAAPDSAAWPGFLSVADIRGFKLDASLVTLSACETGLGRLERGEGVVGLTRAFLGAGAASVVVSLWSVNDASTATLMNTFYQRLLAGNASRASSLAKAKRALLGRADTRSPFYWAPFILVGASGPLPQ